MAIAMGLASSSVRYPSSKSLQPSAAISSLQLSTSDSATLLQPIKKAILIDIDKEHRTDQELDCTSDLGDRASDPEVTSSTAPLLR